MVKLIANHGGTMTSRVNADMKQHKADMGPAHRCPDYTFENSVETFLGFICCLYI